MNTWLEEKNLNSTYEKLDHHSDTGKDANHSDGPGGDGEHAGDGEHGPLAGQSHCHRGSSSPRPHHPPRHNSQGCSPWP